MLGGPGDATQKPQPAAQTEMKTVNVFVAAKPISVGTTITQDMIATQPWPEHLALPGFIKSDEGPAAAIGMVARGPFQAQEPLIATKLANPNDPNFLAGDLPKGMRVVTIPINEVDGVAGFVFPGDHVDVIYTHDVDKWEHPPASMTVSTDANGNEQSSANQQPTKIKVTVTETLITNVKVLAIDQRASGANATDDKGNLIIPRSASLMVSTVDSQRVRQALKTGTLSVALRALVDKDAADPLLLTAPKDVTQSTDGSEDAANMPVIESVKILRGASKAAKEQSSSTVSRGAPKTSGTATTVTPGAAPAPASNSNQPMAAPSGTAVINPALVAVP